MSIDVLPLSGSILSGYDAQERGRLIAAGMLSGDLDLLIEATAATPASVTLLANNRRHFERLTDLDIVSV